MATSRHWKQRVAGLLVLGLVLVCLTGCLFFIISLAPCRFRLAPGTLVRYDIRTEVYAAAADGSARPDPVRSEEQQVHLVCVSDANEVALVSPGQAGQHEEVTLLRFDEDGSARRMDPALRLLPDGKAVGFFDFNLLPLPEGLDQTWRVGVIYAVPPPGKRRVEGRVRRISNGLRPEFELELDTIEWTDPSADNRYRQLRDLSCRYRYDASQGIVDQARLELLVGVETDAGPRYYRCAVQVAGEVVAQGGGDDVALRDLALATARVQLEMEEGRTRHLQRLVENLREAATGGEGPVHELARKLVAAAEDRPDPRQRGAGWVVQVMSLAQSRRDRAQGVVDDLKADGYPAFLVDRRDRVAVRVGPYPERSDAIVEQLRGRFRAVQPIWLEQ